MVFSKKPIHFIIAILVAFLPLFGKSASIDTMQVKKEVVVEKKEVKDEAAEQQEKIDEVIGHHVLDGHSFTLFADGETGAHYGFSLPIILWDNGLQVFSSSKFNNGESVAESNGNYYFLHHEKIYKTDAAGKLSTEKVEGEEHVTNAQPLDFSITKGVLTLIVVAFLMFFLFVSLAKSYAKNGGISSGVGRFFEPIVLYVRDEIAIPNIGEKHYKKYMSYLLTIFFFVWFLNIFGLTPLGINVTGNISITFGLAIITYLITTFTAKKDYWKHIFWMP